MTSLVKDELSRVSVIKPCCRKAEVSTLLRFAGGLHLVDGRIVVEAELDTGAAARRLRKDITEIFGHSSELIGAGAERPAQGQPVRRAGGTRTAKCWPARPGWSMVGPAGAWTARARWWPAAAATARRPGAGRSWPTAR